ncbi:MAG: glycosyltransferase family 4 protein [Candidatus Sumerlaeia bacterium]
MARRSVYYDPNRTQRVALDVRMWRHSGIGSYIRGLCNAMARIDAPPPLTCLGPERFAKAAADLHPQWETASFNRPVYSILEQIAPPRILPEWGLYHSPHYNFPLRWPSELPLVVTIHDLIHLDSPSWMKRKYMRFFLKQLENHPPEKLRVITGSDATRDRLGREMPYFSKNAHILRKISYGIAPLYLNAEPTDEECREWRKRYMLPDRYFLMVGNSLPHKNHAFVIRTLLPLMAKGQIAPHLVICGLGEKGMPPVIEMASKITKKNVLHCLPHIPQREMPLMYAGAEALIFPSLEEGYGLPVVEAQAMGAPTLVSDRPATREAGGKAAMYFDPEIDASLISAVKKIQKGDDIYEEMVRRGRERTQNMSWERAAEETVKVYREFGDFEISDSAKGGPQPS